MQAQPIISLTWFLKLTLRNLFIVKAASFHQKFKSDPRSFTHLLPLPPCCILQYLSGVKSVHVLHNKMSSKMLIALIIIEEESVSRLPMSKEDL